MSEELPPCGMCGAPWPETCRKLEQQLELSEAIGNGFSTALFKAEAELAALREVVERSRFTFVNDVPELQALLEPKPDTGEQ